MTTLLEAKGLNFAYPSVRVLSDVSLTIGQNESHAVIGPNGAGKTTLFKVLSGEIFPQAGSVLYQGRDVTAQDACMRVRHGIGRTFQVARLFSEQTVLRNVLLSLECRDRMRGKTAWWRLAPAPELVDEARHLLSEYRLSERADDLAENLSHGDKKRLELLVTLAQRPRLIMLDEPTAGMAPGIVTRSSI